jgi:hypothetical protein
VTEVIKGAPRGSGNLPSVRTTSRRMSELLSRFTFQESKLTTQIWVVAAGLWFTILLCTISSILVQPFTKKQRFFWIALVTLVPIFGLLAYLPFSIRRDELPTAFLIRGTAKDRKKDAPRLFGTRAR